MSKPPAPSDIADKFMLRMPEGMRDRLKAAAEKNNRSMNAEIVSRIEDSFLEHKIPENTDLRTTTEMGMLTMLNFIELIIEGDTTGKALKEISSKFRDNIRKNYSDMKAFDKYLDIDTMKEKMRDHKGNKSKSLSKNP